MTAAPAIWIALAVVSALGGFIKGATGFGGALVLAPFFVILVGPWESTVLIVLMHALTCLQGLRGWRGAAHWPSVGALGLVAVVSGALLSRSLDRIDVLTAKRLTGGIVIAMALLQVSGWRWRHKGGAFPLLLTGVLSGACTAISGTGGPPAVVYFAGGSGSKEGVRGSLLAYFVILYTLSGATLIWQQKVTSGMALRSAILAPLFFVGGMAGERVFLRMANHHFDRLVAGVLVVSGAVILFF